MYEKWLFMGFGILLGIAVTMITWLMCDRKADNQRFKRLYNPEFFCYNGCMYAKKCYEQYKDTDEAEKALDEYCCKCPIVTAYEVLDDDLK